MKKSELIVLTIVLGFSALLGLSVLSNGHAWGDDFAAYIMQAQSILKGNEQSFVERNTFTIEKSSFTLGPVTYPWGYPLILASVYAVTGLNLIALKLPGLVFFIASLLLLYLFSRRRLSSRESLLLMGVFAFHPQFLSFLDQILSDMPYLFFSMLALLLIDNHFTNSNGDSKNATSIPYPGIIGAIVFIAYFMRTIGLILLPTFLMAQAVKARMQRRDIPSIKRIIRDSVIFCLIFGIFWFTSRLIFPTGHEIYLSLFGRHIFEVVTANSVYYFELFGQFFDPLIYWNVTYWIALIFFSIGVWATRRQEQVSLVYFGFLILVLVSYPLPQGIRFIFPLLPLFVYFGFQGMKTVTLSVKAQYSKIAMALTYGFWSILLIASLFTSVRLAYINLQNNRNTSGPFDSYSRETYQFIINNTAPDDVVAFFKPRLMHLMTNRNSLAIDNCKQLKKMGDYIIINKPLGADGQVSNEAILQCNLDIKQVFENPVFVIYRTLNKK